MGFPREMAAHAFRGWIRSRLETCKTKGDEWMRKGVWIIALLPIIILLWIIGWTLFWIGTEQQSELRETVKIVVPITEEITA